MATLLQCFGSEQPLPPAISTFPLFNRVAVASARAAVMEPVGVNLPVAGSYSSAEA